MADKEHDNIGTLAVKVSFLSEAIQEIKEVIKTIESSVSIIRLLDLQYKQQGVEVEKLQLLVKTLSTELNNIDKRLDNELDELAEINSRSNADVKSRLTVIEDDFKAKFNTARGLWLAVSFFVVTFGGLATYLVKSYISQLEEDHAYVQRLRILNIEQVLAQQQKGK